MKDTPKKNDLIAMLEPYFTKQAPFQIPENGRKLIVEWLPWINLVLAIFGILALLSLLTLLGIANVVTAGAVTAASGPFVWLSFLALMAQIAVQFIAFPGLRKRQMSAWLLLFWANIIFFAYGVLNSITTNPLVMIWSIVWSAVGTAIGLYILFQIKSHYK